MRTIRIKLYKFSELSESAKEKAINKCSEFVMDYDWWDSIYSDAEDIGLKITSFDLDRNRHATGEFMLSANEVAANIFRDHGESCETYKTAESFMEEWQPVFNNYMDENHKDYESKESEDTLNDLETDFLNSLLEDYSIMLQKESEYMITDEYITDFIEANEYEFTKEGKLN